ncbi:hypothetical protein NUACC21_24360 [Scytonema sp. NUACC21]
MRDSLAPKEVVTQSANSYFNKANCRNLAIGKYLAKISTLDGRFVYRLMVTLAQDGNVFVADSNQRTVPSIFKGFANARGAWKCVGNSELIAIALNFSHPPAQGTVNIGRTDYRVTLNPQTKTVQGSVQLRFFDLSANPFEENGLDGGMFSFTGQRVIAK